jgi:hypothetical protein
MMIDQLLFDAIRDLISVETCPNGYFGRATDLLHLLNLKKPLQANPCNWPKSAQALGMAIASMRPKFLRNGFEVRRHHTGNKYLYIMPPPRGFKTEPELPPSPKKLSKAARRRLLADIAERIIPTEVLRAHGLEI